MTDNDWPLHGDIGDLIAADPFGHIDRTYRAALEEVWAFLAVALGIPPITKAIVDQILEDR